MSKLLRQHQRALLDSSLPNKELRVHLSPKAPQLLPVKMIKGSQSKEPTTASTQTKVTADTGSPATNTQTSTVKVESPSQKGSGGSVHHDASQVSSAPSGQSGPWEMVPQHLLDPLEMVPQHLARVGILMVYQILQRPRLTSQQRVHQLNRLMWQRVRSPHPTR